MLRNVAVARVKKVAVIIGTRPEAVKLAPVVRALKASRRFQPVVISTSQHGHMVEQICRSFGISIDHDLKVMRKSQTLWDLSSRLATRLGRFFDVTPMDAVLVQGDTTSALFGGLCAFYHQIPVGHVEAGLRTGNSYSPFPEEINRKLLADISTWHFAPTKWTVRRLRSEGIPARAIYLTGNTVVDALRWMTRRARLPKPKELSRLHGDQRLVLVTCHRRENLAQMKHVGQALANIARRHANVLVLFPVHPNPAVRDAITPPLRSLPNVILREPMDYDEFLVCLKKAFIVLSDSGGVQEEATAMGRPVLVLRDSTERPEGLDAGALKLVGTSAARIVRETERLLADRRAYQKMARASNVFGDGHAAKRIVKVLEQELSR